MPTVCASSTRRQAHAGLPARYAAAAALVVLALLSGCSSGEREAPRDQGADAGAAAHSVAGDAGRRESPGHCRGAIGAVTVAEVRVPSGATCRLHGTTVIGNVSVGSDGRLIARRTTVKGDVEGRGARHVSFASRSLIGGTVTLLQGGSSTISHAEIRSDLDWTLHTGQLTVRQTVIGGDLRANRNSGRLVLVGSRIGGDLQCLQNLRLPIRGDNVVLGQRTGQCALIRASVPSYWNDNAPEWNRRNPATRWRPPCAGDSVSDDPSDDECGDD